MRVVGKNEWNDFTKSNGIEERNKNEAKQRADGKQKYEEDHYPGRNVHGIPDGQPLSRLASTWGGREAPEARCCNSCIWLLDTALNTTVVLSLTIYLWS